MLGSELLFKRQFGPNTLTTWKKSKLKRPILKQNPPTHSVPLRFGTYLRVWIGNVRTAGTVRGTGPGQRGTGDIENVFRWGSVRMISIREPPHSSPRWGSSATGHGRGWRGQASDLYWTTLEKIKMGKWIQNDITQPIIYLITVYCISGLRSITITRTMYVIPWCEPAFRVWKNHNSIKYYSIPVMMKIKLKREKKRLLNKYLKYILLLI